MKILSYKKNPLMQTFKGSKSFSSSFLTSRTFFLFFWFLFFIFVEQVVQLIIFISLSLSLSLSLWIWISRVPLHKKKFRCHAAWNSPHTHVHTSAYGDKSNVSYLEEKWIFKYCLVVKLNIFNLVIPVSSLLLYCLCTRI